ncbi:MAG: hypothetical protein IJH40_08900 [Ruminococcus sp.]|uniref:hypothetical protein n=1 Tax=Ruminococcus sp. TaxID=41978 RepID=UPI002873025D|nr:hypothetical protein [Ruminococcus sp.]MBQ3285741.1 hypothetical protein [Ruminococcus sp.]
MKSTKNEAIMNDAHVSPLCDDVMTDPRVPIREKFREARSVVVRSPHLIKAVFTGLANAPAKEVFKRGCTAIGETNLPPVFRCLGISEAAADQITFADLMLLIRDTAKDERFDRCDAMEDVVRIVNRLRFQQESQTLSYNRPHYYEDGNTAFCLRQFLYTDPFVYIRQLLKHDDALPTDYPYKLSQTNDLLLNNPCFFRGRERDWESAVMYRCIGTVLQYCIGKVQVDWESECAEYADKYDEEDEYETKRSAFRMKDKPEYHVMEIVYDLIVTPFALYADAQGQSLETIRQTIEDADRTAIDLADYD